MIFIQFVFVHTCRLAGQNPVDYLDTLQIHAPRVVANPALYMPWNFRQTLGASS